MAVFFTTYEVKFYKAVSPNKNGKSKLKFAIVPWDKLIIAIDERISCLARQV
jgi:hypothetical protein